MHLVNSDSGNPPEPPDDAAKNRATALFAVGLLVYWLGGFGSCAGLGKVPLMVVYPIVVAIGLALQITGIVLLTRWANRGANRRYGCLMTCMYVALLLALLFSMLSLPLVFGGMHM